MKPLKAFYQFDLYVKNTDQIETKGCNALTFVNQGLDDLVINKNLNLAVGGGMITFGASHPAEIIDQKFTVNFATNIAPQLLVIRKYVNE